MRKSMIFLSLRLSNGRNHKVYLDMSLLDLSAEEKFTDQFVYGLLIDSIIRPMKRNFTTHAGQ